MADNLKAGERVAPKVDSITLSNGEIFKKGLPGVVKSVYGRGANRKAMVHFDNGRDRIFKVSWLNRLDAAPGAPGEGSTP